jgi:hypothetical protein
VRWGDFVTRVTNFAKAQEGAADPYLFHGTSALRAAHIVREGFHNLRGRSRTNGTFWAKDHYALHFAHGGAFTTDDYGVILTARLSDVMASGVPEADLNYDI